MYESKNDTTATRFVSLMEKSTLTQATITIMLVGTLCALVLMGRDVPEIVTSGVMLVMGFYFGSKHANVLTSLRR